MTTVIKIHGRPFTIGFGEADDARRKAYFKNGIGTLTPQEKSLLVSLGVDSMLENSLKPYLAEFFSTLQTCSGDTSLVLSRDCETAFFVIWSALFHNRAEVARRMKNGKGGVVDDLDLAQDASFISGMKPHVPPAPPIVPKNTYRDLFTLMLVNGDAAVAPAQRVSAQTINQLFTLMVLNV